MLHVEVANLAHEQQALIDRNSLLEDDRIHLKTKLENSKSENVVLKETIAKRTEELETSRADCEQVAQELEASRVYCEQVVAIPLKDKEEFAATIARMQVDWEASHSLVEHSQEQNQNLDLALQTVQHELALVREARPDDLIIVTNYTRSPTFHFDARYWYRYYTLLGYVACRMDIVRRTPGYDNTGLRFLPAERFRSNGDNLLLPPIEWPEVWVEGVSIGPFRPQPPAFQVVYLEVGLVEDEIPALDASTADVMDPLTPYL